MVYRISSTIGARYNVGMTLVVLNTSAYMLPMRSIQLLHASEGLALPETARVSAVERSRILGFDLFPD